MALPAHSADRIAWRGIVVAGALASLLAGPGCIDIVGSDLGKYVEREEKHFPVAGKPDVTLSTFDGSIEIRPWDKPEIQVVVEKRGRDKDATATIEVHAEATGNHVEVRVTTPKTSGFGFHFNDARSAKLIVSLPASADVSATSGDGSIRLDGVDGKLNVDTGDGSIAVAGKLTAVRARSGDGSVTIQADAGSAPAGDWDITTGDGSVTLEVPDGFGAELDAHTGDGSIRMQDITLSNVTGEIGKRTVRGRLGAGGPAVRVRTGDGSITLKRS
jgi:DUF4097 and DUF4098 domain-containing protein YvlB